MIVKHELQYLFGVPLLDVIPYKVHLWAATPKEPSLHGFHPPKEIGFQRE